MKGKNTWVYTKSRKQKCQQRQRGYKKPNEAGGARFLCRRKVKKQKDKLWRCSFPKWQLWKTKRKRKRQTLNLNLKGAYQRFLNLLNLEDDTLCLRKSEQHKRVSTSEEQSRSNCCHTEPIEERQNQHTFVKQLT